MEFEWDEDKRQSNIAKHGIDFLDARRLFDGRPAIQLTSSFEAEERYLTIGYLDGRFVTAVWTWRHDNIRFISVRHARQREIESFFTQRSR